MKTLSMGDKLKVIEFFEIGTRRADLMSHFNLKRSTLHDVAKKVEGGKSQEVFRSRKLHYKSLDKAVYKWYVQQHAEGLPVRGLDIQNQICQQGVPPI